MKRLFGIMAVAMAICGCSERGTLTDGRFVVGFDAEFPPYGFKQGDDSVGFDLDLARELCARKGWTFVANPINWDSKDMALGSGAIDCIWNGFTMQGREDAYTWTKPYVDNSQVVIVKAGSAIASFADLAGRKVGVQTDTPVLKALSAGGEREKLGATFRGIVVMPSYNQAVMDLESGAVDAVALDIGVAKKKMADMPGKFKMLEEIVMSETYGVGFKKGNEQLRDQVESELKKLFADGTAAKIAAKYGIEPTALILK